MEYDFGEREHIEKKEGLEIKLSGVLVGEVERLKYLGCVVQKTGAT